MSEDTARGEQKRTTKLINDMLNSLVEYLRFTTEDHLDFEQRKLPTLDCELWVENNKILHAFFEKPQVPNRVLLESTPLSHNSLTASFVQEGVRRLINTSEEAPEQERTLVLDNYAQKLINSGHDEETAKMFLVHAVTCYMHKESISRLPVDHPEYSPLHLSKNHNRNERIMRKITAISEWFKSNDKTQSRSWRTLLPKEWRWKSL